MMDFRQFLFLFSATTLSVSWGSKQTKNVDIAGRKKFSLPSPVQTVKKGRVFYYRNLNKTNSPKKAIIKTPIFKEPHFGKSSEKNRRWINKISPKHRVFKIKSLLIRGKIRQPKIPFQEIPLFFPKKPKNIFIKSKK